MKNPSSHLPTKARLQHKGVAEFSEVLALAFSDKWIGELSDMHRVAEIDVGEKSKVK